MKEETYQKFEVTLRLRFQLLSTPGIKIFIGKKVSIVKIFWHQ